MAYRVMITGQRDWYCPELADRIVGGLVAKHGPDVVIIEGGAEGVDRAFAEATDRHPVGHETHEADWKTHGKRAGPMRNRHMIRIGADLCIAVHKNILDSRGTKDCVIRANAAGIPCWLVQGDEKPKRLTEEHIAAIRGEWEPPGDEPVVQIQEAPAGSPGNVSGVVQAVMRGAPEDRLDDKGKPPLIDGPPQFGQPPVSFWSHALGVIGQANGRWKGDHPTEPEPIHWEEVLLHLAFVSKNASLHARDVMDEKITQREWVQTLETVLRHAKGGAGFLEDHLTHYIENAIGRAEERLVEPPAEPPAPEPTPERHANRTGKTPRGKRPPAPSLAAAQAKLDAAAQAKPKPTPKRKGKT